MSRVFQNVATGGCLGARRLFVATALGLCLCSPETLTAIADEPKQGLRLTVREDRGVYQVSARFDIPELAPIALAVLTDYEGIPRFMPDVKTSTVRQRIGGGIIVEQEAVARMMMFSKRIHLTLEVHSTSDTVRFQDSSGRSFARYKGAWRLTPRADGTTVDYQLTAEPSFEVPAFLLTRLLKRDAREMVARLRAAFTARAR